MTPGTLTLEPGSTTSQVEDVVVSANAVEANRAMRERRIPLTIPSAQEYYWHYEWQQGEREASAEREAGDIVRFDSDDPEDIVRWLREPDDDE